ncbi:VanW family protein [Micromonospora echinofusca]|uniref:VanW family protein n=1 Tax=Micromonospora echinofusca TaxID=47858 RepID=UPI001AD6B92D|nr:VanW family protein [Micromonospora echinofusca]
MPVSLYGKKELPADERPTVQVTAVTWPMEDTPVGSPPTTGTGASGPRRGRRGLLVTGGVVVALLAATAGTGGYAYAGEVPRGIQVLGAELGGKSRAAATTALQAELDRRAAEFTQPVPVRVADQTVQLDPAAIGLTVDVPATVEAAAAARPDPLRRLFGSHPVDPVVAVDQAKLDAVLRTALGKQARQMTMPGIKFSGTTPKPAYPAPSRDVDAEESARVVRAGWLTGQPITVPLVEKHPATSREEVDRLVAELARPAVAAPVKVTTPAGAVTIAPRTIASSLVFTADKAGKLTHRVDAKKLRTGLAGQLSKIEVEPKNARVLIEGGKPKVVPGTAGRQLDTEALSTALLDVLPKTDGREVSGTLKASEPETTPEEVAKLGIKERVSTFTTKFTGGLSAPRSQNIVTIAKAVDGAVVKPGATFSLNGHTGERSYAKGYRDAPVILDGKLVPGVGGGTSQFTTTLFNATYYAGLEDVEHKPHSYWFSRYPPVIESTIFWPDLDFKFRNNTPYGVVIDTSYTSSSVTVSIWSTRIWDSVKTEWSPRRNITKPRTIYLPPGPSCIATNGIDGFTQDAWRIFRKDGREVRREKFSWTYQAEPRYLCAKQPGT